jgi:protein-L-isoaspartate(D-aspartate) O-methyltransferase
MEIAVHSAEDHARFNMIEQQIRTWDVLDNRVLEVMLTLPRHLFAPARYRALAYADTQIPLGHKQVMEEPRVQARLLQSLNVQPLDRILDVGTGSGYLAACLASLGGDVLSVDIFPEFTEKAQEVMQTLGLSKVKLDSVDAGQGLPDSEQRFDVIAITGALPTPSLAFQRSLTIGGRMFVLMGKSVPMEALLITREDVDQWRSESLFEAYLPALLNAEPPPSFVF